MYSYIQTTYIFLACTVVVVIKVKQQYRSSNKVVIKAYYNTNQKYNYYYTILPEEAPALAARTIRKISTS